MEEDEIKSNLTLSSERVGKFYPVLFDAHGNVIDGLHRLAVDRNWPTVTLDHVRSEKDLILARLISNVCRRRVKDREKTRLLGELGKIHLKEGTERSKIPLIISEETGMSYRWVMQYLPNDLKKRPGIGGPSKSHFLDKDNEASDKIKLQGVQLNSYMFWLKNERKVLKIKKFSNTDFVHFNLERECFEVIERKARDLGAEPETILNNLFLMALRILEDAVRPSQSISFSKLPQS